MGGGVLNPDFVNATDVTAAGGDYTPGDDSDLLGLSRTEWAFMPFDIAGTARSTTSGAAGAYANLAESP